mgnify:FL=1
MGIKYSTRIAFQKVKKALFIYKSNAIFRLFLQFLT